ncbi:MAG: 50S ribosomal protein L5 [Promethearchaeota archaeon]
MPSKTKKLTPKEYEKLWKNPMKKPYLEKIVLNIGVGAGGEELERAKTVLEQITGQKAIKTISKKNIKEFNLRKGRPIGAKVTIRGEKAEKLLQRLIIVQDNKILMKSFDNYGNFSFGINEHIEIPKTDFDSDIGIWGLNVCGRIIRPGMRVKTRRIKRAKIPKHHYVSYAETQYFLKKNYKIDSVKKIELEYL